LVRKVVPDKYVEGDSCTTLAGAHSSTMEPQRTVVAVALWRSSKTVLL